MKRFLLLLFLSILFLSDKDALACLRTDLQDRPKEEVLKKSLDFAQTFEYSSVTGAVVVDGSYISSGIALDPQTVLTTAHSVRTYKVGIFFNLSSDGWDWVKTMAVYKMEGKPILHPEAREGKTREINISTEKGEIHYNGFPLKKLLSLDLIQLKEIGYEAENTSWGVDLAIIKLKTPLPCNLKYPMLPTGPEKPLPAEAIIMGYGAMMYNNVAGSEQIWPEQDNYPRHLYSCNIRAMEHNGRQLLCSDYEGKVILGRYSYLAHDKMKKMEAMPVRGDSGGPVLIQLPGDKHCTLQGIASSLYSVQERPIEHKILRALLYGEKQRIFAIHINIAHYLPWIKANMGPVSR